MLVNFISIRWSHNFGKTVSQSHLRQCSLIVVLRRVLNVEQTMAFIWAALDYSHVFMRSWWTESVIAPCCSVTFDKCMNKISRTEQIDFIVRYWDIDTGQVSVRYLGSEFLGHATAADLLTHFKDGITQLDPKRLLQVSMDGPSVNWKVYTDLARERKTQELLYQPIM